VHFHLLVPDGVFVDDEDRLAFALHPVPTSTDVVAILDRIARRLGAAWAPSSSTAAAALIAMHLASKAALHGDHYLPTSI
jgi:hypothetical protein